MRDAIRPTARTHLFLCSFKGDALADAVKEHFPGASVTRCERGKVDVDLVLGVDSFSLDKALEARKIRPCHENTHLYNCQVFVPILSLSLPYFVL